MEEPVKFSVRHGPVPHHSAVSCVYWHFPSSSWATHGCSSRSISPSTTSCSCSHLTSFALIVIPPPVPVTWAPLTYYSAAPSIDLSPYGSPASSDWSQKIVTGPIRRGATEKSLQGLLYSAPPSLDFEQKIRVTRRERTEDVLVFVEVESGTMSGGLWTVLVILPVAALVFFISWRKRKKQRLRSVSSISSIQDEIDWDQVSCYGDTFLNSLEEDIRV